MGGDRGGWEWGGVNGRGVEGGGGEWRGENGGWEVGRGVVAGGGGGGGMRDRWGKERGNRGDICGDTWKMKRKKGSCPNRLHKVQGDSKDQTYS